MINRGEFITGFKAQKNDADRWQFVLNSGMPSDATIMIDNDDVSIWFNDDSDDVLSFNEFGYDALYELLCVLDVKADYV